MVIDIVDHAAGGITDKCTELASAFNAVEK